MGLFSNVIHCWRVDHETVIKALGDTLTEAGFVERLRDWVSTEGPRQNLEMRKTGVEPVYFVSPRAGSWVTIIEGDYVDSALDTANLARQLSERLETFALSLIVHDDDLMFYNLFDRGAELDGYNSCPQYFENDRLSEDYIEGQRHSPEELLPVLPPGVRIAEVTGLLNRGWWDAHDTRRLDADGVEPDESDSFVFEGERMTAFGTLLKLHGDSGSYPYAGWLENPNVPWQEFEILEYSPAV